MLCDATSCGANATEGCWMNESRGETKERKLGSQKKESKESQISFFCDSLPPKFIWREVTRRSHGRQAAATTNTLLLWGRTNTRIRLFKNKGAADKNSGDSLARKGRRINMVILDGSRSSPDSLIKWKYLVCALRMLQVMVTASSGAFYCRNRLHRTHFHLKILSQGYCRSGLWQCRKSRYCTVGSSRKRICVLGRIEHLIVLFQSRYCSIHEGKPRRFWTFCRRWCSFRHSK